MFKNLSDHTAAMLLAGLLLLSEPMPRWWYGVMTLCILAGVAGIATTSYFLWG
jgi:hypothetical protein